MCFPKFALVLVAAVLTSISVSAKGNEPCKVLTAQKFSQIMGYEASTIKTSSNETSCFYQGACGGPIYDSDGDGVRTGC
jgi:hypothetical protein